MCLTIPKQVIAAKNGQVRVRSSARDIQEVGTLIKVKKGDWVLSQNNVIIRKVSEKQAKEIDMLMLSRGRSPKGSRPISTGLLRRSTSRHDTKNYV